MARLEDEGLFFSPQMRCHRWNCSVFSSREDMWPLAWEDLKDALYEKLHFWVIKRNVTNQAWASFQNSGKKEISSKWRDLVFAAIEIPRHDSLIAALTLRPDTKLSLHFCITRSSSLPYLYHASHSHTNVPWDLYPILESKQARTHNGTSSFGFKPRPSVIFYNTITMQMWWWRVYVNRLFCILKLGKNQQRHLHWNVPNSCHRFLDSFSPFVIVGRPRKAKVSSEGLGLEITWKKGHFNAVK